MASTDEYPWIELSVGSVRDRGHCIWLSKLSDFVRDHWGQVVYRSFFTAPESFKHHVEQHGSSSSYRGSFSVPRLVWDIDADDADRLDEALSQATELVRMLKAHDVPEGAIQVWFSGRRGFHIETPDLFGFNAQRNTPENVRNTMTEFYPDVDKKPLKRNGLIRARWAVHPETGLHKVPFTIGELERLSAEDVRKKAKNPRRYETERKAAYAEIMDSAVDPGPILEEHKIEEAPGEIVAEDDSQINRPSNDPSHKITCMDHLWNRGPKEGRRNSDIHEMVRAWRSQGINSEACIAMAWSWVRQINDVADDAMKKAEVEMVVRKVFRKGYTPSCDRDTYEEFCDPDCIFYDQKNFGPKSTALEEEATAYLEDKQNEENVILNLGEIYPREHFTLEGGEVFLLIGDTGIGKTALIQNWVVQLTDPERGTPLSVYFNTPEMGTRSMMDRFLQLQYGLAVEDDYNQLKQAIEHGYLTTERVQRATSNIHMSTESLSVQEVKNVLVDVRPDLMVIDPLEDVRLQDGGYDRVGDQKKLVTKLQEIGAKTDTAIIIIHHINKQGMNKSKLTLKDAKGASAIAQKADFSFAFEGRRDGNARTLRLLKKRRNQSMHLSLVGDPATWRFELEGVGGVQTEIPNPESGDQQSQVPHEDVEVSSSPPPAAAADELQTSDGTLDGVVDDEKLR